MTKPTLLITGGSGFLGWHLCHLAQAHWQVYATRLTTTVSTPGVNWVEVDLRDYACLKYLFTELAPDAVIHTAAESQPNACQLNPAESYAINVVAPGNLAGLCADRQIPCVFTSTDLVFDGQQAPYRETDPVAPVNRYGEQKVEAEALMQARHPGVAICRMPLMYGAASTAKSFIQPFIAALRSGETLKLFTDEYRTPVSGTTAAQGLLMVLEQKFQGVIHLGGRERLSRYQFGQILAEVLQLPQHLLQECQQAEVPMAAPRAADVSLDSSLAFGLGYEPATVRSELLALSDRL